jgi:hypothetical protein
MVTKETREGPILASRLPPPGASPWTIGFAALRNSPAAETEGAAPAAAYGWRARPPIKGGAEVAHVRKAIVRGRLGEEGRVQHGCGHG